MEKRKETAAVIPMSLFMTPSGINEDTIRNLHKESLSFHEMFSTLAMLVSIAERFAGFEGVGDALLSFAFAAEGDEGFAFEVEDVLLGDGLRRGERAASEDIREFARDERVVVGDVFAAQHLVDGELRGGEHFFAEDANLRRRGRMITGVEHGERGLFGVGDKTVAIHGDEV